MPSDKLILSGGTLYGMTQIGGSGTIFQVGTDGSDFSIFSFNSPSDDGDNPAGDLLLDGTSIYGIAQGGSGNSGGLVFEMSGY